MVLPKDVRKKMGIAPGAKLALVAWERDEKVCCLSLFPAGELDGVVRHILQPMVKVE
jgi:bifunctional DNA-binding transcriptional regulator/antitoxin component of YhaV-PrlF toxin-antitoxin module